MARVDDEAVSQDGLRNSEVIVRDQFEKLTGFDKLSLSNGIRALYNETVDGFVQVATGCSGTDLVLAALDTLFELWNGVFGVDLAVDHLYSSESKPMKQRFLQENFSPPHIFPDIGLLKHKSAVDLDGRDVMIRTPLFWICGVECDSISALNSQRGENFDCVGQAKESRTGTTGRACMEYIAAHRPPIFLLECVRNLQTVGKSGKSNLILLQELANAQGYLLLSKLMNCYDYGTPQQRDRSYLVGILIDSRPVNQTKKGWVAPPWVEQFVNCLYGMKVAPLPLEKYLLDQDNPSVMLANAATSKDKPAPKKKTTRKKTKPAADGTDAKTDGGKNADTEDGNPLAYEVEHLSQYFAAQVTWPPQMDSDFLQRSEACTERQRQVLWLLEQTQGRASSLKELLVRDLHMSSEWQIERSGFTPCIVSSSALWVRGPCRGRSIGRFLGGAELLSLQGLDFDRQSLEGFSHGNLVDLAGNAFCSSVIFPLVTALIAFGPVAAAIQLSKVEFMTDEVDEEDGEESEQAEEDQLVEPSDEEGGADFDIDDMHVD